MLRVIHGPLRPCHFRSWKEYDGLAGVADNVRRNFFG